MNQIITELNVFEGDSEGIMPTRSSLNYKQIINDPIEYKSGNIALNGTTPNKIYINNVNFINLMGTRTFTILLNEKVVLYTKQFSFMNLEETINLVLVPRYVGPTNVKYNCGFLKSIDSDSPIYCLNVDVEFDSILEDLIIEQRLMPDDMLFTVLGRDIIKNQYDSVLNALIIDDSD